MADNVSKLVNAVNEVTNLGMTDDEIFQDVLTSMDDANNMPQYESGAGFYPYGSDFTRNPKHYFDYLGTLADKYGLVFIKNSLAQNPLTMFKRGEMTMGGKIESVVFDTIAPKVYRPDLIDGAESPFAQNFGKVVGETYTETYDVESSNTIVDTQDVMSFQNITQFHNFVFGKISQLINGVKLGEFYTTKMVLAKSLADGMINSKTFTDTKDLQKKILYYSRKFQYFSRDHNAGKINQATRVEDIIVILPLARSVDLDVDFMANAFNPELFHGTTVTTVEVDEIPSVWVYETDHVVTAEDNENGWLAARDHPVGSTVKKGTLATAGATDAIQLLNGDKVGALVLDRDALQLWDQLPLTLSTEDNPRKRYTNIFANQKTFLMFVKNLNAIALLEAGYTPTQNPVFAD